MKKGLLILLVLSLTLLGCGPSCPKCPEPSSYSTCNEQAMKTRTNYKCSEATNFQCETFTEEAQCNTEIKLKGYNLDAVIKPSIEERVKGIVKIEATKVNDDTKMVFFAITGHDIPPLEQTGPNIGVDTDGSNGWSIMLDTTKYKNGLYDILVGSSPKESMEEGQGPAAYAQGQIVISN